MNGDVPLIRHIPFTVDGALVPPTHDEIFIKPEHLTGEMEDRTLAWLYVPGWTPDGKSFISVGHPEKWDALAMEFADGGKVVVFAVPVEPGEYPPFRTIMAWRWMERPALATRAQLAHWRGRSNQPIVSPIQVEIHGLRIAGVRVHSEPNREGGQTADIEFREPVTLQIRTRRRAERLDPGHGDYAAFELGLKKRRMVVLPGGQKL